MKLNILPASIGAQWVRLGARTFFRQPLALGALYILSLLALSLVAQIPVVGDIVALALVPALTVGLMAAVREADGGKKPLPTILFIAFRQGAARANAMIRLGLLYAAAVMLVMGVSTLIDNGHFLSLVSGSANLGTPEQATALMLSPRFSLAMLVTLALYTPVSLAFWHAPALAHWHGVPPIKSLFFSCVAVLKNIRPFLLYGLVWLGLSLVVSTALMALTALTGNPMVFAVGMLPATLLLYVLFFTSIWFTFRDSFTAGPPLPDNTSPVEQPAP